MRRRSSEERIADEGEALKITAAEIATERVR